MTGIKRPLVQDLPYSSTPCSIADPIEAGGMHLRAVVSPSWSSQQNNYDAGYAHVIRANVTVACDLTGIDATVSAGRRVVIFNIGSATLTLKHESASSTAANRLSLTADILLYAGSAIELWYDETTARWRHVEPIVPSSSMSYSTQGSNFNAAVSNGYIITANCTATLPSTATRGDKIAFYLRSAVTSFVVGRNTRNIQGVAEDMTVDLVPTSFTLVFDDTANGWWLE